MAHTYMRQGYTYIVIIVQLLGALCWHIFSKLNWNLDLCMCQIHQSPIRLYFKRKLVWTSLYCICSCIVLHAYALFCKLLYTFIYKSIYTFLYFFKIVCNIFAYFKGIAYHTFRWLFIIFSFFCIHRIYGSNKKRSSIKVAI